MANELRITGYEDNQLIKQNRTNTQISAIYFDHTTLTRDKAIRRSPCCTI